MVRTISCLTVSYICLTVSYICLALSCICLIVSYICLAVSYITDLWLWKVETCWTGLKRVWRYQREVIRIRISKKNRQWPKEKVQKDKTYIYN
jgi:hypothetical protein